MNMKLNFKRLMSLVCTVAVVSSLCVPSIFAQEPAASATTNEVAMIIEEELRAEGSSIRAELEDLLAEYKRLAITAQGTSDRVKFEELAVGVEAIIFDYEAATNPAQISPNANYDAIHAAAVAAVLAYFTSNNCNLAGELLTRAKMNTDTDYIYTPTYSSVISNSSTVRDIIRSGVSSGSGEITQSESLDGYYAVHLFNYRKQGSNYIVTDVYDYERGDPSYPDLAGVAVNAMADAQEDGYLVPYTVWIYC